MVDRIKVAPKPVAIKIPVKKITAPAKKLPQSITQSIPGSSISGSDEKTFEPNSIVIFASPGTSLATNQWVTFSHNAAGHQKSGTVLGKQTAVDFVPISQTWHLPSGESENSTFSTNFLDPGTYRVRLEVTYSVYAAIEKISTRHFVGNIVVSSALDITVAGDAPYASTQPKFDVLLVSELCGNRRDVFGCEQ